MPLMNPLIWFRLLLDGPPGRGDDAIRPSVGVMLLDVEQHLITFVLELLQVHEIDKARVHSTLADRGGRALRVNAANPFHIPLRIDAGLLEPEAQDRDKNVGVIDHSDTPTSERIQGRDGLGSDNEMWGLISPTRDHVDVVAVRPHVRHG